MLLPNIFWKTRHAQLIVDFNKPDVLCSSYNTKELLIKETLLIQQHPDINVDRRKSSITFYVFNNLVAG